MKSRKAREQEAREPVLAQLRGLVSALQGATEQMAATVSSSVRAEVQHQLHVAVGRCVGRALGKVVGLKRARPDSLSTSFFSLFCSLQESILAQVQRIVKGEVSVALKEQQAAVTSSIMQAMRSAAGTPVPTALLDCQAQQAHILQLLQQGHLNQAFQQVCQALGPVKGQVSPDKAHIPYIPLYPLGSGWSGSSGLFWFSLASMPFPPAFLST